MTHDKNLHIAPLLLTRNARTRTLKSGGSRQPGIVPYPYIE
ncbi:hypothetical protein HMPREF0201_03224 [Cedecea davisae DSM 4568]|uniref:Uncharacterized protein n=1 Tax=Cedecea davisae DSM 4568 TaxID=566551 RepID=S3J6A3_9ENTR|nr:hypothetical protein HMPREF0201_03224 [Cedecea davisae DSM 4568]